MIEFKKERNLNQLVEDTFLFVTENYKALGMMLLNYAGPFLLVSAIANVYLQHQIAVSAKSLGMSTFEIYNGLSSSPYYWLSAIFGLLASTVIMGVVFYYIQLYMENALDEEANELILNKVKENFSMILLTNLLVGMAILAGLFLFIVGATFLLISLSFTVLIRVYSERDMGEAFRESMRMVKDNWWDTAIKQLVVFALILLSTYVLAIPEVVYNQLNPVLLETSEGPGLAKVILSSATSFASSLLTGIYYVSVVFIYFSLREKKGDSLKERLNSF